ncbi:MAG TPA: helix-turn-helix transcriptional regulator [Candidatus Kapabacteria bacterium]|nr:helix-turn-helix transcriptional regulator [Candidatus Kapabacteria bacterium]
MRLEVIVATNVRNLRKKKNLTQEALAIKAGLSPNFLACFERGETGLALSRLEKIAKALGVKPSLLLEPDAYRQVD